MLIMMGAVTGEMSLVLGIFAPEMLVISAVCFGPVLFPALARLIAWPLVRKGDVTIRMARDNVAASAKRPPRWRRRPSRSRRSPLADPDPGHRRRLGPRGERGTPRGAGHRARLLRPTAEALAGSSVVTLADASAQVGITLIDREGERELEDAQAIDPVDAVAARCLQADRDRSRTHAERSRCPHRTSSTPATASAARPRGVREGKPVSSRSSRSSRQRPPCTGTRWCRPAWRRRSPTASSSSRGLALPTRSRRSAQSCTAPGPRRVRDAWLAATDADLRRNNTFSLWVLLGPSGFYAALAIANTLLMGSLQRHREFVATRLIGATERQVRKIVLWESALVTATRSRWARSSARSWGSARPIAQSHRGEHARGRTVAGARHDRRDLPGHRHGRRGCPDGVHAPQGPPLPGRGVDPRWA